MPIRNSLELPQEHAQLPTSRRALRELLVASLSHLQTEFDVSQRWFSTVARGATVPQANLAVAAARFQSAIRNGYSAIAPSRMETQDVADLHRHFERLLEYAIAAFSDIFVALCDDLVEAGMVGQLQRFPGEAEALRTVYFKPYGPAETEDDRIGAILDAVERDDDGDFVAPEHAATCWKHIWEWNLDSQRSPSWRDLPIRRYESARLILAGCPELVRPSLQLLCGRLLLLRREPVDGVGAQTPLPEAMNTAAYCLVLDQYVLASWTAQELHRPAPTKLLLHRSTTGGRQARLVASALIAGGLLLWFCSQPQVPSAPSIPLAPMQHEERVTTANEPVVHATIDLEHVARDIRPDVGDMLRELDAARRAPIVSSREK